MRALPLLTAVLSGLLCSLLVGCEPSCRRVCDKLLDCEGVETPRVGLDDCETQCERHEALLDLWESSEHPSAIKERDDFGEQKRCVMEEECRAIDEGACYDEDLYAW